MSPYWGSQHHSSLLGQGDTHRPWLTLTAAPQPLKGAWSKHCKYNTLQRVTKVPLLAPEWPFLTFPAQHLCSLLLLKARFSPLRKKPTATGVKWPHFTSWWRIFYSTEAHPTFHTECMKNNCNISLSSKNFGAKKQAGGQHSGHEKETKHAKLCSFHLAKFFYVPN